MVWWTAQEGKVELSNPSSLLVEGNTTTHIRLNLSYRLIPLVNWSRDSLFHSSLFHRTLIEIYDMHIYIIYIEYHDVIVESDVCLVGFIPIHFDVNDSGWGGAG